MSGTLWLAGQRITAATLNLNIPGPWTTLTPQNGWAQAAGGPNLQFRQFNSAAIQIVGRISGGTITNGTTVAQLPTLSPTVFPITTCAFPGVATLPTSVIANFQINVSSSGAIKVYQVPSTTTELFFNAIIALDV